jgi:hypothetical protein
LARPPARLVQRGGAGGQAGDAGRGDSGASASFDPEHRNKPDSIWLFWPFQAGTPAEMFRVGIRAKSLT